MAEGNIRLGKVAFVDKGTYSSATTYNTFDFITTDDSCYLCIKDGNKGHALTETTWSVSYTHLTLPTILLV